MNGWQKFNTTLILANKTAVGSNLGGVLISMSMCMLAFSWMAIVSGVVLKEGMYPMPSNFSRSIEASVLRICPKGKRLWSCRCMILSTSSATKHVKKCATMRFGSLT